MNTGRPSTRRKPWMVVAVAAALSLAAGSCGDDDGGGDYAQQASTTAGPATTGADEATPRRGGTFTYLQTIELTGWDVTQQTTVVPTSGSAAVAAVYDVLVYVDLEDGEVKGQTAESLTSTDAREWTLKLKPNIEFTDGTAYDADAVKFNWERHADPANRSSHQSLAASIASMTVVDPLTLRITLKSPNGQFDRLVAGRIPYIGSPTAMRQDPAGFTTKPVGAGPFMLREWVRDSRATLVRNPNYWDAPRPHLDELVIRQLPDAVQRYNSFSAGEGHGMTSFGSFDNYQRAKADGYQVIPVALPVGGGSIWFNTTRPPFDDIRARRAIILGLNYEQADQTINGGAPETAPPRFMIRPPSPLHDPSVPLPAHDAREAQRLLNELNAEKGGPLEFSLSATPGHRYAEFFQSQLTQFDNVEVSVVPVPGADYIPTLAAGRFDAIMFGAAGFDPEPDWYDWYYTGATRNFRKYSNPRMDAALDTGRTSLDPQRRREAYRTVQQLVIEDALEAWYTPNAGGLDGGFILAKSVRDFAATGGAPRWEQVWLDD